VYMVSLPYLQMNNPYHMWCLWRSDVRYARWCITRHNALMDTKVARLIKDPPPEHTIAGMPESSVLLVLCFPFCTSPFLPPVYTLQMRLKVGLLSYQTSSPATLCPTGSACILLTPALLVCACCSCVVCAVCLSCLPAYLLKVVDPATGRRLTPNQLKAEIAIFMAAG
jgi:hypothetical protein